MECAKHGGGDAPVQGLVIWGPCGTGPYWPFPQLSVGDVHGIFMDRMLRVMDELRSGDRTLRTSVAELAATCSVTREEVSFLNRLVKIMAGEPGIEMLAQLRELQAEMLLSVRPTPAVALAIISIGIDSLTAGLSLRIGGSWVKNDVDGAVAGATVGGAIGGPGGAGIGALAGAIVLSCFAARSAKSAA